MNRDDTARVLTMAAAYDQRTIGDADVSAWHAALHPYTADDAGAAVVEHYTRETRRIMPADVVAGAKRLRAARSVAEHHDAIHADDGGIGRPADMDQRVAYYRELARARRAAGGPWHLIDDDLQHGWEHKDTAIRPWTRTDIEEAS